MSPQEGEPQDPLSHRPPDETWVPLRLDIMSVLGQHRKDDAGHCTGCMPTTPRQTWRVRWPCQKARIATYAQELQRELEAARAKLAAAADILKSYADPNNWATGDDGEDVWVANPEEYEGDPWRLAARALSPRTDGHEPAGG